MDKDIMNNVLITGGAGFIGSNLALSLIEKGYNVTVLDNLSKQIHGDKPEETSPLYISIKDKVNFILGTVASTDDMRKAIKGQNIIVHFAAETGTGQSMYEINKYTEININGTTKLLDLLVNEPNDVKKVVVASSRAIYGEGKYRCKNKGFVYPLQRKESDLSKGLFEVTMDECDSNLELVATSEDSKIHPTSVYGITKQVQEQMILTVCPAIGIAPVAFRYQNVYGPGQSLSNPYTGILSIFSTRIKNGNELNIFEDGKETRDFVYIDDIVEATILGIEKDEANGQVFNVGSGISTDVFTIANTLIKKYGTKVSTLVSGNYRVGDIRHNYADMSKINSLLGFKPQWTFEKGISKFVDWVEKQKVSEDKYEISINEMKKKGLYK